MEWRPEESRSFRWTAAPERLADIFGFGRAKDCGRITLQALRIVARFLKIAGAD
jgi:hypothetical protein